MRRHAIACLVLIICSVISAQAQALPPAAGAPAAAPGDGEPPVPESRPAQEDQTAEQACGQDRRCRIARLKRQNRARRYTQMLKEERLAKQVTDAITARQAQRSVRLADPMGVEFQYTFLGPGLLAGYILGGNLRIEAAVSLYEEYVYQEIELDGGPFGVDAYYDLVTVALGAVYLWGEGRFLPYTGGGIFRVGGSQGFSEFDDQVSLVMHGIQAQAGFEVQFALGLRARLGAMFRYPVYKQAGQDGQYVEEARKLLENWFSEEQRFSPEFSIGWAF